MRVGILQLDIIWGDIQANLDKIESIVKNKLDEIDLLIFPEMFSTGFSMRPDTVAQEMDGQVVYWMKNMAINNNLLVAGSVIIQENEKFYNRFIITYPNGQLSFYDKRHLFRMGNEDKYYDAGNEKIIIEYKGVRIRPLVCYDLRFPVWSRNLNDYDLLIYVANWPVARKLAWDTLLSARAIENQCYVIGVNRIGKDNLNTYVGGSVLYNYKGNAILSAKNEKDRLIIGEINIEKLKKYRNDFPAYLDSDIFKII